jgi:hypothetical protein
MEGGWGGGGEPDYRLDIKRKKLDALSKQKRNTEIS